MVSDETENGRAARYIQYALSRGKTVEYLLQFPITTRPIFSLKKDELFHKKSQQSVANKSSLQDFFLQYCIRNYKSAKPLYLAGGLQTDPNKCTVIVSGKVSEATCPIEHLTRRLMIG